MKRFVSSLLSVLVAASASANTSIQRPIIGAADLPFAQLEVLQSSKALSNTPIYWVSERELAEIRSNPKGYTQHASVVYPVIVACAATISCVLLIYGDARSNI